MILQRGTHFCGSADCGTVILKGVVVLVDYRRHGGRADHRSGALEARRGFCWSDGGKEGFLSGLSASLTAFTAVYTRWRALTAGAQRYDTDLLGFCMKYITGIIIIIAVKVVY